MRAAIAAEVAAAPRPPALATILIGDDPASAVYISAKRKACAEVGIESVHHDRPGDVARAEVLDLIDALNADERISGILCQLPLPGHLDPLEITNRIDPGKDVDGLTVTNAGRLALGLPGLRPCTPVGVMRLLAEAQTRIQGAHATVVGRSNLFGKPMAQLLTAADATVTLAHRRTADLPACCQRADILIAAVGQPRLIGRGWIKPGATVIDVGITRTDDGLVGDVDYPAAAQIARAITPVPGGVGPLTIACLLQNTAEAASQPRD
jgi:methylenetetrahydrofolate dehydrogenase (NADP+)/methenyltetrahydrofolate cyclohydrolase